jgi:hypothetical protein
MSGSPDAPTHPPTAPDDLPWTLTDSSEENQPGSGSHADGSTNGRKDWGTPR